MTETETTERRTEVWTYIGQRMSTKGKGMHTWLDEDGEARLFSKLRGDAPGARYEVTCEGDSVFTAGAVAPRYVGMHDNAEQRSMWAAEDRVTTTTIEAQRLAKRQTNELSQLCAPLREQMRKTIGHSRRAALLAAIIEEVQS